MASRARGLAFTRLSRWKPRVPGALRTAARAKPGPLTLESIANEEKVPRFRVLRGLDIAADRG